MNHGYDKLQEQQHKAAGAPAENAASAALARLNMIYERLGMVEDRLSRVITRAFGEPQRGAGQSGGPVAVPSGTIGSIGERLDTIDSQLSEIGERINRIDQII